MSDESVADRRWKSDLSAFLNALTTLIIAVTKDWERRSDAQDRKK